MLSVVEVYPPTPAPTFDIKNVFNNSQFTFMKTIQSTPNPRAGAVIDINAIPAEVLAANANAGVPSSRLYENDILDFSGDLRVTEVLDASGKKVVFTKGAAKGQPVLGYFMAAEITNDAGQTITAELDLANILSPVNRVIKGAMASIFEVKDNNLDKAKKFAAWVKANPSKKFKVTAIEQDSRRKKDGSEFLFDVAIFDAI